MSANSLRSDEITEDPEDPIRRNSEHIQDVYRTKRICDERNDITEHKAYWSFICDILL